MRTVRIAKMFYFDIIQNVLMKIEESNEAIDSFDTE
jgi:hypothetical protein